LHVFNLPATMIFPNLRRALASLLLVATSIAAQKSTLKQVTASIGSNPQT
jgi:hypothetical protein